MFPFSKNVHKFEKCPYIYKRFMLLRNVCEFPKNVPFNCFCFISLMYWIKKIVCNLESCSHCQVYFVVHHYDFFGKVKKWRNVSNLMLYYTLKYSYWALVSITRLFEWLATCGRVFEVMSWITHILGLLRIRTSS